MGRLLSDSVAVLAHLRGDVAIASLSAYHLLLRALGASRKHAYVVRVRGEPLYLRVSEPGVPSKGGLYATRVVMARSQEEAEARVVEIVREEVIRFAENPKESPVVFEVEECWIPRGIVWRQRGGFTLWDESMELDS